MSYFAEHWHKCRKFVKWEDFFVVCNTEKKKIKVYKDQGERYEEYKNPDEGLRECAASVGFSFDEGWDTF